jgi:hypothetical protein
MLDKGSQGKARHQCSLRHRLLHCQRQSWSASRSPPLPSCFCMVAAASFAAYTFPLPGSSQWPPPTLTPYVHVDSAAARAPAIEGDVPPLFEGVFEASCTFRSSKASLTQHRAPTNLHVEPLAPVHSSPSPTHEFRQELVIEGQTDVMWSVAFSANGKRILSASDDTIAWVWDSKTGAVILVPLTGHTFLLYTLPMENA